MELDTDKTGVLVIDVQGDFTEYRDGALAVRDTGKSYLKAVSDATQKFSEKGVKLFATRDFHPEGHVSFFTSHPGKAALDTIDISGRVQVLWPPHCVMDTKNSEILLDKDAFEAIVKKGCHPEFDSYSGFFDDGGADTGLNRILKEHHLQTLVMYGLATDYCVKFTAMDGLKSGFDVIVLENLCRGVAPDTTRAATKEMTAAGIHILNSKDVL